MLLQVDQPKSWWSHVKYIYINPSRLVRRWTIIELSTSRKIAAFIPQRIADKPPINALSTSWLLFDSSVRAFSSRKSSILMSALLTRCWRPLSSSCVDLLVCVCMCVREWIQVQCGLLNSIKSLPTRTPRCLSVVWSSCIMTLGTHHEPGVGLYGQTPITW